MGGSPTRARTGGSRASAGRWERVMVSPRSLGHREQSIPCLTRPNQEGSAETFHPRKFQDGLGFFPVYQQEPPPCHVLSA
jgi:hypothetical protein